MDIVSKTEVMAVLKKERIFPSRKLGQNFLIDETILKKIIKISNRLNKDTVLAIGPAMEILTRQLAKKAKRVIAVEKDPKMVKILKKTLEGMNNVKIIFGDILTIKPSALELDLNSGNKIIANLPYSAAAPAIRRFLENFKTQFSEMTLLIQKEVAQRICAAPPRTNLLAVSVQFYAKPKIMFFVPKESFFPQPKVDGAVIKIIPLKTKYCPLFSGRFFKILKAGFSHPRKQILNNLSTELKLDKKTIRSLLLKNGISPEQRAESLKIKDWINLAKDDIINQGHQN